VRGFTQGTAARLARAHRIRSVEDRTMRVVEMDTHKATLAACALERRRPGTVRSDLPERPGRLCGLLAWLRELGGIERIGLEGSAG
jgi:hypothetical protein